MEILSEHSLLLHCSGFLDTVDRLLARECVLKQIFHLNFYRVYSSIHLISHLWKAMFTFCMLSNFKPNELKKEKIY